MTSTDQVKPPRPSKARARLVQAASELFYSDGIRNVSIEQVLDAAHVTRSTLYRYFDTKDDLVFAYLEREDQGIQARFAEAAAAVSTPDELLQLVVGAITHDVCGPGFRGCPFMNAAIEYPESDHQVRTAVKGHRSWFFESVRAVLMSARHPDPDRAGRALVLLRDGSMMGGYLDDPDEIATALEWAVRSIVGDIGHVPARHRDELL
jgi:AcrR family transcriptional regulator